MSSDHPFGTTLVGRDTAENRRLFPNMTTFGYIPVEESVCDGSLCPHYHKRDAQSAEEKDTAIHILIASFRDQLCPRTVHNAFMRASNPDRIFLRIIQQTQRDSDKIDDAGCWDRYCTDFNTNCQERQHQVQTVAIDAAQAQGPTYARSRLSAMIYHDYIHATTATAAKLHPVQVDDYCMQIDSHMDFSTNYDVGLIQMFHRTENDYAVLSTYVTDIEFNNKDPHNVPNLCMVTFTSSIRNWGTKECVNLKRPKLTNAMWGAGLSFHRCHAELAVPVDPYLDGVFDGEEGSRGIRFFTHGYDVYAPDKVLVTHDYKKHQGNPVVHTWGRGTHQHHRRKDGETEEEEEEEEEKDETPHWDWWNDIEQARSTVSVFGTKRVNMLLGIGSFHNSTQRERHELDLIRQSRFGLGTKRSLAQVRTFTGINLLDERMETNRCGNLKWVPYQEDDNGPHGLLAQVLARPYAGETPPTAASGATSQRQRAVVVPPPLSPPPVAASDAGAAAAVESPTEGTTKQQQKSRLGSRLLHPTAFSARTFLADYSLLGAFVMIGLVIAMLLSKARKKEERHKY